MTLTTSAQIEIATGAAPDAKTRHLLRQRLEIVLEEAIDGVLAEFDLENQFMHAVRLDPIDVAEEMGE